MNNTISAITNTDSYKFSHYLQLPPLTEFMSSYIEARGGDGSIKETVFFGIQMFIKQYLMKPVTHEDINIAKEVAELHGEPFNEKGWRYIVQKHKGYLPIEIQAVPEGLVLPVKNAVVQVINTDPKVPWISSYIETPLLRAVWYPMTIASRGLKFKKIIAKYMKKTCDSLANLDFKLVDFGARSATSEESAGIGGSGHLVYFKSTDNVSSLMATRRNYSAVMAGSSIPASEHGTMTPWGRKRERDAYINMIKQFGGKTPFAIVSDSYNLANAVDEIFGKELRDMVIACGSTLVVRPDSGDPVEISIRTIESLMNNYGYIMNKKGYKLLPDCIRVIQGDGINEETLDQILSELEARQISADNITFGMGGELLQSVGRDDIGFAMKTSAALIYGEWVDVCKDPVDSPWKRSRSGRLAVVATANGSYETIRIEELGFRQNILRPIFRNGKLLIDEDFDTIRARANVPFSSDPEFLKMAA